MKTVTLYTDGACSGNPGPGGWGAILEFNGVEKELSGGEDSTTNNRMELTGVTLYTDGACSGNPGPGGWGAILEFNGVEKELSGGEDSTTNNRMELTGVIRGLEALKEPCIVELYSDSKYVIDALEKGWAWGWKKRGWVKSDKKPALNADLWEQLLETGLGQIRQEARPECGPVGAAAGTDPAPPGPLPLGQGPCPESKK